MREQQIDLWRVFDDGYTIAITTNGTVKQNGECVMGRGCARQARDRFPGLAKHLGDLILQHGNIPIRIHDQIVTLPVKHQWYQNADPELIKRSLELLVDMADAVGLDEIYIPRPGCGNGHLSWEADVKPLCESILDDRFIVVTF